MSSSCLLSTAVRQTVSAVQQAARARSLRDVPVDGRTVSVPYPFPSPGDWRDHWIYFLVVDRFNNPVAPPRAPWNQRCDFRQGGTFNGIRAQLGYLRELGAGAIWLTPVLKNSRPDHWRFNYHGYGIQDFLSVDERFGSDGTRATAERELGALVDEAHARGLYVIFDIVLNHAARVFDYLYQGGMRDQFTDSQLLQGTPGSEVAIQWLNGFGVPRADWQAPPGWPSGLPASSELSADDAVWPSDLQRVDFFRRRGTKVTDEPPADGHIPGDFETMRQLVVEYVAADPAGTLRACYGRLPVLNILIQCYQYLIARYDVDGFRMDTVKYLSPRSAELFGNAIREFALSAGKANFFTFGEVWSPGEATIARYVGRNSTAVDSFGIDAALDFPLFYALTAVAKGRAPVECVRAVFDDRKAAERELLSSHGEAGRFFVSFLDNHDQHERFFHPLTLPEQLSLALTMLFGLQGIPCLYYGTEQGLRGTVTPAGRPDLGTCESVREALWGREPAFDRQSPYYALVQQLARVRRNEAALRYGRLYFREVSGNGTDFGPSTGAGGVIACSRILVDREVVIVANTHWQSAFSGWVLVDPELHPTATAYDIAFSNRGSARVCPLEWVKQAVFHGPAGVSGSGPATAVRVNLQPLESQILVPA